MLYETENEWALLGNPWKDNWLVDELDVWGRSNSFLSLRDKDLGAWGRLDEGFDIRFECPVRSDTRWREKALLSF